MMDLMFSLMEQHTMAAIVTDRAVTMLAQLVGGFLTMVFLVYLIKMGIGRNIAQILSNIIIFSLLLALTVRPEVLLNIGLWILDLFVS